MAREYSVRKAVDIRWQGRGGVLEQIEDGILKAEEEIPDNLEIPEAARAYDADAELVVSWIIGHLPQGTIDRLLVKLMERKVSFLRTLQREQGGT